MYAKTELPTHGNVSYLSLDDKRIGDFDSYFENFYQDEIDNGQMSAIPESLSWPVSEYKDQIHSLETKH